MPKWDTLALTHNDHSCHTRAQCHVGISSAKLAKLSATEETYTPIWVAFGCSTKPLCLPLQHNVKLLGLANVIRRGGEVSTHLKECSSPFWPLSRLASWGRMTSFVVWWLWHTSFWIGRVASTPHTQFELGTCLYLDSKLMYRRRKGRGHMINK